MKHSKYLWQHNSTQYVFSYILSYFVGWVPKFLSNHVQPSRTLILGYKAQEAMCGEGRVTGFKQPGLLTYCTDCCLGLGVPRPTFA